MPTQTPRLALRCLLLALAAPFAPDARAANDYPLGPDSQPQAGVPRGKVTQHRFVSPKVFAGTERDYWVYVPAQYDGKQPACVTVFQDGGGFQDAKGPYRATVVLDNLIHKKEVPVTVGVFINPGVIPASGPGKLPRFNRSFEYDTPSDQYARFLLEEMLPEVAKAHNLNLTNEGAGRAICGASSGGVCAFTAAWERPNEFSRVVSFIGSFTNLRGAHDYPTLIRKSEPKPVRVFMQDGRNDLDIYAGSWFIANNDVAAALSLAGYEHQYVVGEGGHDSRQAGQLLPDALRFVWKDYPKPPAKGAFAAAAKDTRPTVMDVVIPGEEWQLVGEGYKFTEGPAADAEGNVFFTDLGDAKIYKVGEGGKPAVFVSDSGNVNGLMFGPDGRLYACQSGKKRVVAYDKEGKEAEVVAEEIECNDLCVDHKGGLYVTEPVKKQVWYVSPPGADGKRQKKVVDAGALGYANGVILTPDQGQLVVSDTKGVSLYAYRVEPDGSLSNRESYFSVYVPAREADGGADGLTVDTQGRLYAATRAGVQVFDQAGRVNGIISKPDGGPLSNVAFGGKDLDTLYATCGGSVYKRKTKAKGVLSFRAPVQPPAPKL